MIRLIRNCVVGVGLAGVLWAPAGAAASDHKEAPLIQEDPSADIADIYAFKSPANPSNVVLVMTVNPFTVPSENVNFNFSPNVRYRFSFDLNNDGRAESDLQVTFGARVGGQQLFGVRLPDGSEFTGQATMPTEDHKPNPPVIVEGPGGVRAFAGPRDDPFFFDVVGFNRFLAGSGTFSGTDGFAGFNVSAIAIELPAAMIATNGTGVFQTWGTTERRKVTLRRGSRGELEASTGPWEQIERMGNPAINTALIPAAKKDYFNVGMPENDARDYAGDIVASLRSLGTNDKNIGILASVALPDTLKVDMGPPTGYPNGRTLGDDVVDTLFFFIFNQTKVGDGVPANDVPFEKAFPYLAAPHQPA